VIEDDDEKKKKVVILAAKFRKQFTLHTTKNFLFLTKESGSLRKIKRKWKYIGRVDSSRATIARSIRGTRRVSLKDNDNRG